MKKLRIIFCFVLFVICAMTIAGCTSKESVEAEKKIIGAYIEKRVVAPTALENGYIYYRAVKVSDDKSFINYYYDSRENFEEKENSQYTWEWVENNRYRTKDGSSIKQRYVLSDNKIYCFLDYQPSVPPASDQDYEYLDRVISGESTRKHNVLTRLNVGLSPYDYIRGEENLP